MPRLLRLNWVIASSVSEPAKGFLPVCPVDIWQGFLGNLCQNKHLRHRGTCRENRDNLTDFEVRGVVLAEGFVVTGSSGSHSRSSIRDAGVVIEPFVMSMANNWQSIWRKVFHET